MLSTPVRADGALDRFAPSEVVVKLQSTGDLAGIQADFGLSVLSQFGARPIYRMQIGDGVLPPDKAALMSTDSRVLFAEPNYELEAPESNARSKPGWAIGGSAGTGGATWALDQLRLSEAHSITRGGGVLVAVLDTGVDASHPLLTGKLLSGYDFVDDDANPAEEGNTDNFAYGHGTHVAGVIAQAAPDSQILPVRVLTPDGAGNIWVLAEALAYAVDPDGDPQTDDGAHVINLSLGTPRRTSLIDEIVADVTCNGDDDDDDNERCARTGGAVVVAAAGNLGDETPNFPAAEQAQGVLAVAASTQANTLAEFSTRGTWVHIAAPGEHIVSSVPGNAFGAWSGTSMAAPFTAGVAALVRSSDSTLKPADITARIESSAAPLCGTALRQADAAAALGAAIRADLPCSIMLPTVVHTDTVEQSVLSTSFSQDSDDEGDD